MLIELIKEYENLLGIKIFLNLLLAVNRCENLIKINLFRCDVFYIYLPMISSFTCSSEAVLPPHLRLKKCMIMVKVYYPIRILCS